MSGDINLGQGFATPSVAVTGGGDVKGSNLEKSSTGVHDTMSISSGEEIVKGKKVEKTYIEFSININIDPKNPTLPPPIVDILTGGKSVAEAVQANPWLCNCSFTVVLMIAMLALLELDKQINITDTNIQLTSMNLMLDQAKITALFTILAGKEQAEGMRKQAAAEMVKGVMAVCSAAISLYALNSYMGKMQAGASAEAGSQAAMEARDAATVMQSQTAISKGVTEGMAGMISGALTMSAADNTQKEAYLRGLGQLSQAIQELYSMMMQAAKDDKSKTHETLMALFDAMLAAIEKEIQSITYTRG